MYQHAGEPQAIRDIYRSSIALFKSVFITVLPIIAALELLLVFNRNLSSTNPDATVESSNVVIMVALGTIIFMIMKVVTNAIVLYASDDVAKGQKPSMTHALTRAIKKFFPLLIGSFLVGLAVLLGSMFFFVPGVMALVGLIMFYPAIVLDNKGIIESLKCSWNLVWGNWWFTAMTLLIAYLAIFAVTLIVTGLAGHLPGLLTDLAIWIVYTFGGVFYPCLLFVLYHELKLRAGPDFDEQETELAEE